MKADAAPATARFCVVSNMALTPRNKASRKHVTLP
jgi:hypothetical protein